MKMTGAQILCESLVREGVEVMFGILLASEISDWELGIGDQGSGSSPTTNVRLPWHCPQPT